jgi:hypothetical protein
LICTPATQIQIRIAKMMIAQHAELSVSSPPGPGHDHQYSCKSQCKLEIGRHFGFGGPEQRSTEQVHGARNGLSTRARGSQLSSAISVGHSDGTTRCTWLAAMMREHHRAPLSTRMSPMPRS